ncbi:MAG TPA: holo-ACP synthase [Candidatus Cloacimonadota bacterium]|nr:holo-ACP synthase [Candidatus Cloacimonadota bacterium]
MIRGIGTDIVAVGRIERSIERTPRFVEKVFTETEVTYCEARANSPQSYAARFAAKEAVMKAFGTGWNGTVNWRDIDPFVALMNTVCP